VLPRTSSPRTPLEDEFTRLLESHVPHARDCRLVRRVLGWDGQPGCCLKHAGEEFGITRERARQIYDQAIERISAAQVSCALDEALVFVKRMSNRAAEDVAAELQRQGFTRCLFSMQALLKTAEVFGRVPPFTVEEAGRKMFIVAGPGVVQAVIKAALRLSASHGVQNIAALRSGIPRHYRRRNDTLFIRQVLNTRRDIRWLDTAEETFWLASVRRNPMVRCIEKVICYASPVTVSDLHRAIGRLPAVRRTNLSRRLFIKFCEQTPFCRVANGCVERIMPLAASNLISDAERLVCRILRQNGNKLPVERLQSLCDLAGVGRPNFWRIVLRSPLIFRPAPGIYSVISASPHPIEAVHGRTA
jgi:hypothetical protein